jgi:hypothetical protein
VNEVGYVRLWQKLAKELKLPNIFQTTLIQGVEITGVSENFSIPSHLVLPIKQKCICCSAPPVLPKDHESGGFWNC